MCSINPGGGFASGLYRNYNCVGSAPARFVFLVLFCSTVRVIGPFGISRIMHHVFLIAPLFLDPLWFAKPCRDHRVGGVSDIPQSNEPHHIQCRYVNDV